MTEVVAALVWDKDKFMIYQRPAHKARGLLWEFVGENWGREKVKSRRLSGSVSRSYLSPWMWGEVFMDGLMITGFDGPSEFVPCYYSGRRTL